MTVFIVEEEGNFSQAQKVLADSNQSSAVINLRSKTFALKGRLQGVPVDQFMQLCHKTLLPSHVADHAISAQAQNSLPQTCLSNKHKELVEKTCQYIQQRLELPLTLHTISKAMNTNRNSLSKAFKQELNTGVSTWIRTQRMHKARQLLVSTNLSIQEISASLGYPSQANFSTAFKHLFKQSPIQLRRGMTDV